MGDEAYRGSETIFSSAGQFNEMSFVIQQLLGRVATVTLVKVEAVTNAGEASAVGFVDVVPMVHQIDGKGQPTPHGTIYSVPYMRLQGGANAVILDPQVGDIGLALFASRDISGVKATKAPNVPPTRRRFSMADALYIGGVLNGVPTQYVRFHAAGIEVKAPTVAITGDLEVTGTIHTPSTITGDTDVVGGGKSLKTHTHGGVQTGGGNTGAPN